jgi:isonocardicin synthase
MFTHRDEKLWLDQEREITRRVAAGFGTPGEPTEWVEECPFALFQYFLLTVDGRTWLGRKIIPADRIDPTSVLLPTMLMGEFDGFRFTRERVTFRYTPRSLAEHTEVFRQAQADPAADIDFPFPRFDSEWREMIVPGEVWDGSAELAENLDPDEEHLREVSARVLRGKVAPGDVIYDPACSTGAYLASLAVSFPECAFLASDVSPQMVERAKRRIPGAFVADGLSVPVPAESVKVLILRFLNAEVLPVEDAVKAFDALVPLIAPGGYAVVFGHTPVLPAVRLLAGRAGLEVLTAVASRPEHTELFQFYVLRRPAVS